MSKILLLLLAGAIPAFTQYDYHQQPRYSDYGDFGQYSGNEGQGSDFGLQQQSFFDNHQSGSVSSVIGSYGGLTPPPPLTTLEQVNNVHKYYSSERHAIVPSSLRELEESYIRSLSSPSTKEPPYNNQPHQQDGLENFSGFIMTKRHYNKNDHIRSSSMQNGQKTQSAPITYGFPLLNQQVVSATNSIDGTFGQKEKSKKFFDYHKVPNFPDFSDRPPIPEEPEIPSEEDEEEQVEQATRKPPESFILPNPSHPLASPPSIFDPSFPEPVIQRGFIPSFGPPTKPPFFSLEPAKTTSSLLNEHELFQNQITNQQHVDVSTTSPVPVLRPEFSGEKDANDIISDDDDDVVTPSSSTEKPKEGTVYKHISVHVPAEDLEEELSAPKVIKVAKKPEKHIKVIFIKPPDPPTQQTEVEVPAGPQQKTLVYVLSESGGKRTPIRLVTPSPLKPAPPQVFYLRYTDPRSDGSHPTPSSVDQDDATDREEVTTTRGPHSTPPIKQLASPLDHPDAELLRSAPAPVLPTFPSGFSSPASTIAQQIALQSTKYDNLANDPTNSKYHGLPSNSLFTNEQQNNNLASDPFITTNQYSSLYHLYPPPAIASVPTQNLLSLYLNPNNYQQQYRQPHQFYREGQSKRANESPTPSSIQGLYTVEDNVSNLPDINFNSLVQNPDGKNPPRATRNFVMMNYAPTYMPSASGSDHVPVFTSPADLIKSLLGDSYMYYNNIANNSVLQAFAKSTTGTTTTTTTTPEPPTVKSQTQAQHHRIPLILNWANFQNVSTFSTFDDSHQQPLTLVYPHLRPLFTTTSQTTTPKPQARISWTTTPQPTTYNVITGDSVSSHFSNLFHIQSESQPSSNQTNEQSIESTESSSSSDETSESGEGNISAQSGEEIGPKRRDSRKRVNPAHVKPGRRLRKVRKPHKSNSRNRNKGSGANQAQAGS